MQWTANVMECRVGTLVKIADSLGVNLLDVINSSLEAPVEYNFINSEIKIDSTDLPKALKNTIKELEEYDVITIRCFMNVLICSI